MYMHLKTCNEESTWFTKYEYVGTNARATLKASQFLFFCLNQGNIMHLKIDNTINYVVK